MPHPIQKHETKTQSKKSWRLTNQRMAILGYLREMKQHPNAEIIYQAVRKQLPSISFATVYRNLNFLRDHGYIQELVVNKVSHYDGQINAHVHLLCEGCSGVFNIEDDDIIIAARKLASKNNFKSRLEHIELHGLCATCQKEDSVEVSDHEQCYSCGKLKKEILKSALMCNECRFNTECEYYQEAREAQRLRQ